MCCDCHWGRFYLIRTLQLDSFQRIVRCLGVDRLVHVVEERLRHQRMSIMREVKAVRCKEGEIRHAGRLKEAMIDAIKRQNDYIQRKRLLCGECLRDDSEVIGSLVGFLKL